MGTIGISLEKSEKLANLSEKTEIETAKYLTFYFSSIRSISEVPFEDLLEAFEALHYNRPNSSRLGKRIYISPDFVKAKAVGMIKLHAKAIAQLKSEFPNLLQSEDVVASATLLPDELFLKSPAYLTKLKDQINACYEHNIFDGCAVLMRRLLEILLIQSYEALGIDGQIQDGNGNYKLLDAISKNALTNSTLKLSRNSKKSLDDFKKVGNFAAHKIMYSTRRGDIDGIAKDYRGTIEELLYKAGHLS